MIMVGGQILMTTALTTSELALAEQGCAAIRGIRRPRVLIGGLGLGFTLRATLDALPKGARVVVAELNREVIEWCRGPVAVANNHAAMDRRVRFIVGDVTHEIRRVAENSSVPRYDAILWDLYEGPERRVGEGDPLYGRTSVVNTWKALSQDGVFGVWGETPSLAFEARLRQHGFSTKRISPSGKSLRHAVYLATKASPPRNARPISR